eukprot:CAMPEP_0182438218 /NCGR_PEP_ID=MMETSP1167-20130531/85603_1 /TAXON_ID=2988 /ORGANISM="Mallomonas Sp, Strain CCMP3275" /LENGTH=559 /DNA_ID=CAMNT_0024631469 /DNA_START=22 /DNA_END=1698 /DNA_ORIENTATION=+
MTSRQKIELGTRITTIANSKKGVVRFIGDTQFASGEWIGVELDAPDGKNDGSVADVRYFQCAVNHGVFVKRAQIRVDKEDVTQDNKDKISALREKRKARESTVPDSSSLPLSSSSSPSVSSSAPSLSQQIQEETVQNEDEREREKAEVNAPPPPPPTQPTVPNSDSSSSLPLSTPQKTSNMSQGEEDTENGLLDTLRRDRDKYRARVTELEAQVSSSSLSPPPSLSSAPPSTPMSVIKDRATISSQGRRIIDLEEQLDTLQHTMELLSLDKEQVAIDLEEAQETIKCLETELAQTQIRANIASSSSGSTDLETQVERLKEALMKLHQTSSSEAHTLRNRVRELEGAENKAIERAKEVETLTQWQIQAKTRIEELSQAVDEASGYESLLESLTERNLDLTTHNNHLVDTVTDLETAQEVMEELDASQRAELDSLRRKVESAEFQYRAIQDVLKEREREIEESKKVVEKFRIMVEDLKTENSQLAHQCAVKSVELDDIYEKNKDSLSQRRILLSQTERARQLDLLLRRSEIAQRSAEAKAARLEALCPVQLSGKEMRLFQW